jgi:hypothetical protein
MPNFIAAFGILLSGLGVLFWGVSTLIKSDAYRYKMQTKHELELASLTLSDASKFWSYPPKEGN